MRDGYGSFEDFVADIAKRFGAEEAAHVKASMSDQSARDQRTQDLVGRQGLDQLARQRWMTRNMPRYALIASPDAEFVNGLEIALDLVEQSAAEPGTAHGGETRDQAGLQLDALFAKKGIPYRYEGGRFAWAGDRGAGSVLLEPALAALADPRLQGARDEFGAALAHLRAGTLKDREDAIEEAAKAVESGMGVLIAETGTPLTKTATAQNMFDALNGADVVPRYTETALLGAARIRNKRGGHGAGATPRDVALDEATLTVNSAAAALVFLIGQLPK